MARDELRFLNVGAPDRTKCQCDLLDKSASAFNYIQYMFDRTNIMFEYSGLPDTIPAPMLEYMLQIYGSVAIIEHNGELYAVRAEFGGPLDPYYRPTNAVVANPALDLTITYRIVNHLAPFEKTLWASQPPCVRFLNDSQIQGLFPLFSRYATQLVENDISIRSAQINSRQQAIIAADTGSDVEAAKKYIDDLVAGKLSAIGKRPFLDGINIQDVSKNTANVIMQLIELQQYLKASWYNDIGLSSNFNMKSQYISAEEINSNADMMLPLIDNMFYSRQMAVDAVNKQFGSNISVEKSSAWQMREMHAELGVNLNPSTGDPLPGSSVDLIEKQETAEEQKSEEEEKQEEEA